MKTNITRIALIAVALLMVLSACSAPHQQTEGSHQQLSYSDARTKVNEFTAKIKPRELQVMLDPNEIYDLDMTYETMSLPDISDYPFVVNPTTAVYLTVYSTSPEVIRAATEFNNAAITAGGEAVSVGVRMVDSALATDFTIAGETGKYRPDVFIPKSEIYGGILLSKGVPVQMIEEGTAVDVSGVVVPEALAANDFPGLVQKLQAGELSIGYLDPLKDPNGLNFILAALHQCDSAQPMGAKAIEGLREVQKSVRLIANDPAQLKSSLMRGILGSHVLDLSTFMSTPDYQTGYRFIPFGVPQSSPVYAIGDLSPAKLEAAQTFAKYCKEAGASATGNAAATDYKPSITLTPTIAGELRSTYIAVRGGTSKAAAVFVADVSGSMKGKPMRRMKTALLGSIASISPGNSIGLVTYDAYSYIALPIAPFDGEQQSYFSNAVSNMTDGSTTWMHEAIIVGLHMLLQYQDQNPDAKIMLFVLTDGNANGETEGLRYIDDLIPIVAGLKVPVYTIGYESETEGLNLDPLMELAAVNEASFTDAEADNVTYVLSSLLGSQLN